MCFLTANGKGSQWVFHYIQLQEPSPPPPKKKNNDNNKNKKRQEW